MGFLVFGLSLNLLAVGAAAACLLVAALLFSDWAEKRRSRKWLELARQRQTGGSATHAQSRGSRRRRMTAGVVALVTLCALGATFLLQEESLEVKAKVDEFPMRKVTPVERAPIEPIGDFDESMFSEIALHLTPPDVPVPTESVRSNGLRIEAEIWPREVIVSATPFSDPGPIKSEVDAELEYRKPALPSLPRKTDPSTESVLERYAFPR